MSKHKNIRNFLLIIFLFGLISLIVAEISFKRGGEKKFGVIGPNWDEYQSQMNSLGLREKELPFLKDPNTYRILALGDSLTFGQGVDQENIFVRIIEKRLNEKSHKTKFEVINAGIRGNNTVQEVKFFKEKAIKYHPDLVLLIFFQNDPEPTDFSQRFDLPRLVPVKSLDQAFSRKSSLYLWFKFKLNDFLSKYHLRDGWWEYTKSIYQTDRPSWKDFVRALSELDALCRENKIPLVFVYLPDVGILHETPGFLYQDMYDLTMKTVKELRMNFIDLLNPMLSYNLKGRDLKVSEFDGHPNAKAHKLIADELYKGLCGLDVKELEINCRHD